MELFEVLGNFCKRNSGAVSSADKKKYSFMLKRLFAAQYPLQCNIMNNLDSDPELSANIVALLASRYNDLPPFLRVKIDQKKKKESIRKYYEDEVLNKYMEINQCGFREVEEAYFFDKESVDKSLKLIKKNFFNDKEKVIVKKVNNKNKEEQIKLF